MAYLVEARAEWYARAVHAADSLDEAVCVAAVELAAAIALLPAAGSGAEPEPAHAARPAFQDRRQLTHFSELHNGRTLELR